MFALSVGVPAQMAAPHLISAPDGRIGRGTREV